MELKEFIKETISSLIEATNELQDEFQDQDILVNPPVAKSGSDIYSPGSDNYVYRKIEVISFDVALTVGSETAGKGQAVIKIFSAELGASGEHSKNSESVSRVQFSVPIALRPTEAEAENRQKRQARDNEAERKSREAQNQRNRSIV